MSATVERIKISGPNPDPKFNGEGYGIHNGRQGSAKRWHAYIFKSESSAQNYADAINVDYDRLAPVNLGYPEPFAFSRVVASGDTTPDLEES